MKINSRGFTLLEILVAIVLIGIMLVLIGSALTSSRQTLEMSNRYASRLNEVRAAQEFLRQALQQALAISSDTDLKGKVIIGGDRAIVFIAPLPGSLNGGLQTHSIKLANDGSGAYDLTVTFVPISSSDTRPWGRPQYLLQHVRSMSLTYKGLDNTLQPTGWLPTWPWADRFPSYVRIGMDIEGPVQWPDLTVALRSNLDATSLNTQ